MKFLSSFGSLSRAVAC